MNQARAGEKNSRQRSGKRGIRSNGNHPTRFGAVLQSRRESVIEAMVQGVDMLDGLIARGQRAEQNLRRGLGRWRTRILDLGVD